METLAYLHLATECENPEVQELNTGGLKGKAVAGLLGVACAVGVVGIADSASAHGYYSYHHAPVSYRHYPTYHYYSYNYYPRHHYTPRYYNPCYY